MTTLDKPHVSGWRQILFVAVCGATIGLCDLIPGISGGTCALLLGIYEECLWAISTFSGRSLSYLTRLQFRSFFRLFAWEYLSLLGLGMLFSWVLCAPLLHRVLQEPRALVWLYSLICGLVIASFYSCVRQVSRWTPVLFLCVLGGLVFALAFSGLWGGDLAASEQTASFFKLFLSGLFAACAMLLPGVSGSYLFLILGVYPLIITALAERNLSVLLPVALGAGAGLLLFARILLFLLRNYRDVVLASVAGFLLGAIGPVSPFSLEGEVGALFLLLPFCLGVFLPLIKSKATA